MEKRRSIKRRLPNQPTVHFIFESHPEGQPYPRKGPMAGTHTAMVEWASGVQRGNAKWIESFRHFKEGTIGQRSVYEYVRNVLDSGRKVIRGEETSERNLKRLAQRIDSWDNALRLAMRERTLLNIRDYFIKEAEVQRIRHYFIKKNIRQEIEQDRNIEATYGSTHSLLSSELAKSGIESKRVIKPVEFGWELRVCRSLIRGKNPSSISELDYKKGFISHLLHDAGAIRFILQRGRGERSSNEFISDADYRFYCLIENAMISRLDAGQMEEVLLDPRSIYGRTGVVKDIYHPPKREELVKFLDEHSAFWRRLKPAQKQELIHG